MRDLHPQNNEYVPAPLMNGGLFSTQVGLGISEVTTSRGTHCQHTIASDTNGAEAILLDQAGPRGYHWVVYFILPYTDYRPVYSVGVDGRMSSRVPRLVGSCDTTK